MKRKFRRLVALAVAVILMIGVLAACAGNNEGETEPSAQQNLSDTSEVPELASQWSEFSKPHSKPVTWFEQGWTGPEKDKDIIGPEIEKRTNFHMDYIPMTVPTGDDYTQKLNLMVASNDVPDIFFGGNDSYTRTIYEKLGQTDKIWDISEIIKDYDNLYKLVYPELVLYKAEDNKNYFVPTQTGRGNEVLNEPPHGLYVRKDFLDKLGMDYPKTPADFKEYLRRCKEEITVNGQKVNGLVLGENLSGIEQLYESFFPLIGDHESYTLPFDPNDNWKVKNYEYTDSPELMQAAKYIYSLNAEGLLDKEALTIKQAQVQEKASSGTASAITTAWWDMNTYSDNAKQIVPELMYVAPPIMYNSEEIKKSRLRDWTNWVGGWSSVIFNKDKVDEETLRHFLAVMDYLATEDGQMLVQAGVEGETYKFNEDGKYEFLPEFVEKTNALDWNKAAAYGVFYYSQLVFNVPVIRDKQTVSPALVREDNRLGWENRQEIRDHYKAEMDPPKDYYFLPGEIELQKFPAIKDAKLEFWAKVLSAKSEGEVEKLVHEWGRTCKDMGIDEIIAERQAYIDNFQIVK